MADSTEVEVLDAVVVSASYELVEDGSTEVEVLSGVVLSDSYEAGACATLEVEVATSELDSAVEEVVVLSAVVLGVSTETNACIPFVFASAVEELVLAIVVFWSASSFSTTHACIFTQLTNPQLRTRSTAERQQRQKRDSSQ